MAATVKQRSFALHSALLTNATNLANSQYTATTAPLAAEVTSASEAAAAAIKALSAGKHTYEAALRTFGEGKALINKTAAALQAAVDGATNAREQALGEAATAKITAFQVIDSARVVSSGRCNSAHAEFLASHAAEFGYVKELERLMGNVNECVAAASPQNKAKNAAAAAKKAEATAKAQTTQSLVASKKAKDTALAANAELTSKLLKINLNDKSAKHINVQMTKKMNLADASADKPDVVEDKKEKNDMEKNKAETLEFIARKRKERDATTATEVLPTEEPPQERTTTTEGKTAPNPAAPQTLFVETGSVHHDADPCRAHRDAIDSFLETAGAEVPMNAKAAIAAVQKANAATTTAHVDDSALQEEKTNLRSNVEKAKVRRAQAKKAAAKSAAAAEQKALVEKDHAENPHLYSEQAAKLKAREGVTFMRNKADAADLKGAYRHAGCLEIVTNTSVLARERAEAAYEKSVWAAHSDFDEKVVPAMRREKETEPSSLADQFVKQQLNPSTAVLKNLTDAYEAAKGAYNALLLKEAAASGRLGGALEEQKEVLVSADKTRAFEVDLAEEEKKKADKKATYALINAKEHAQTGLRFNLDKIDDFCLEHEKRIQKDIDSVHLIKVEFGLYKNLPLATLRPNMDNAPDTTKDANDPIEVPITSKPDDVPAIVPVRPDRVNKSTPGKPAPTIDDNDHDQMPDVGETSAVGPEDASATGSSGATGLDGDATAARVLGGTAVEKKSDATNKGDIEKLPVDTVKARNEDAEPIGDTSAGYSSYSGADVSVRTPQTQPLYPPVGYPEAAGSKFGSGGGSGSGGGVGGVGGGGANGDGDTATTTPSSTSGVKTVATTVAPSVSGTATVTTPSSTSGVKTVATTVGPSVGGTSVEHDHKIEPEMNACKDPDENGCCDGQTWSESKARCVEGGVGGSGDAVTKEILDKDAESAENDAKKLIANIAKEDAGAQQ
jgi:hypothetical protein